VKSLIFYILFFYSFHCLSQEAVDTSVNQSTGEQDSPVMVAGYADAPDITTFNKKKRLSLVAGVHVASYAGTLFILGQTWYKDFPKTSFHVFDDSKEWLQVDKVGHGWTAYNIAKYSGDLWQWAGVPHKKAVLLGGVSSLGYQTILEYFDAHSAEWGWSWADVGANVFGAGLYAGQELAWKEQRIQFKFSAHKINYHDGLTMRADKLYGESLPERLLKDYNGQTYWSSFNLKSFSANSKLPEWLNVAIGYGATGLFGGFKNIGYDKNGAVIFNRTDIKRQRQWYLSPDVDFTKIKTNKKAVRGLFSVLNMIKVPAPALEFSGGKLKGHFLFF
jgi:hypothetical protein